MKNLSRIEKSIRRKGEYTGYCKGAQKIRRYSRGWETYGLASSQGEFVYAHAPTLEKLNTRLEVLAAA